MVGLSLGGQRPQGVFSLENVQRAGHALQQPTINNHSKANKIENKLFFHQ